MKSCELCKSTARIYCESDQASLCWTCDAKVHSANFLVARHLRCLLCNSCQSPTPWSASGDKIGRTISICKLCVKGCKKRESEGEREESQGGNDEEFESGSDEDSDDEDEDDDLLEEDCDNQVVPWSSTLSSPPPAVSSSDSETAPDEDIDISLTRSPENVLDLFSKDNIDSSSFQPIISPEMAAGSCIAREKVACFESPSLRPFKFRKLETTRMSSTDNTGSTITEEAVARKASQALNLDLNEFP